MCGNAALLLYEPFFGPLQVQYYIQYPDELLLMQKNLGPKLDCCQ